MNEYLEILKEFLGPYLIYVLESEMQHRMGEGERTKMLPDRSTAHAEPYVADLMRLLQRPA